MGVRLIGITRDPAAPKTAEFALDECFSSSERHEAMSRTDVLVLCFRLAHPMRGLVDASALAALPVGALLVNAARGGLIDYRALMTRSRAAISAAPDSMSIGRNHFLRMTRC